MYVEIAVTSTTIAMPVRCAPSFSSAMRRMPSGVVATNSRLPRRISPARVPESARTDHRLAISPMLAAVFQPSDPPSVSMLIGNGLP